MSKKKKASKHFSPHTIYTRYSSHSILSGITFSYFSEGETEPTEAHPINAYGATDYGSISWTAILFQWKKLKKKLKPVFDPVLHAVAATKYILGRSRRHGSCVCHTCSIKGKRHGGQFLIFFFTYNSCSRCFFTGGALLCEIVMRALW